MSGKEVLENLNVVHSKVTMEDICRQLIDTYNRKNADYDDAFKKSMDEFGLVSAAIRLSDKLNRFKSLIDKDPKVKGESILDTLLDGAAYNLMTYLYLVNNE